MNETQDPGRSREQISVTLPHARDPHKLTYDHKSWAGICVLLGALAGLLCGILLRQLITHSAGRSSPRAL